MLSSAVVYLFIIIAVRLFGKKEFAQLSVTDLVFVLLISNAVQNAMVGNDTSLAGGLVAAGTLFIINYLLKLLLYKFPGFQRFVSGEALMLVYKGKIKEENLKKARISVNELIETIHEHGTESLNDVNLVILEADGNISVLSNEFKKSSTHQRKRKSKLVAEA